MKGPIKTPLPPVPDGPQYRLREGAPVHRISGRMFKAGDVVTLPKGMKPGQWMDPVKDDKPDKGKKAE